MSTLRFLIDFKKICGGQLAELRFFRKWRYFVQKYFCLFVAAMSLSFCPAIFNESRAADPKGNLVLMCVSAHPDDEDGATLAYYTHTKDMKGYSIFYTRGEGGQNVTGSELYKELGEMRTEETLAASKILGTQIYFLNFPDFGFSKTAKETFRKWGGVDSVLARIVYMIRALKPDVVITHHDTITTLPYRQHGNHQAVGITIYEAFDKAADPSYHPEQFRHGVTPWQIKKLFFRVLRKSQLKEDSLVSIPVDTKYGLETIQQIAWDALKMHRTQGMDKLDFSKLPHVFNQPVYQLIRGDKKYPYDPHDLFSGIKPSIRRTSTIPEIYTANLKPLSIYVSPEYSLETNSTKGRSILRTYTIDTFNRTDAALPITMYVYFDRHNILINHFVLSRRDVFGPDSDEDHLEVRLNLPDYGGTLDSISFAALPRPKRGLPGLWFQRYVVYLKSVPASFASSDNVGLINTYDNTLQQTFDAFGVKYQILDSTYLASENLNEFTTIILDLRAYLYRHDLVKYNDKILDYVKDGGNVVCFYDRPPEWNGLSYAPYPIEITDERVTEEDQPVTILDPASKLFHYPNRIVASDWNGWVQERNIYLPSGDTTKTSIKYERLLAMSDEDETEPSTSLLWAEYGKGTYIYCSLALYRQVKILNDGGVKLLFNLISQPRDSE